ncbi:MAG: GGDEF domain-containing protein [Planctomycetota bacterium]
MPTPFEIARESLEFVGKFNTPPTPEVFEVWYRYVEGTNDAVLKALSYAVDNATALDQEHITAIHQQFCSSGHCPDEVSDSLASQIEQIQKIVSSHRSASEQFDDSLNHTSDALEGVEATDDVLSRCVSDLATASDKMKVELLATINRLKSAEVEILQLQGQLREAQRSTLTDHLTGIGNRRMFDRFVRDFVARRSELDGRMWMIHIDLDRFKEINDSFGHTVGDEIIRVLANGLSHAWPDVAFVRLGGDEFAAFFDSKDREQVVEFTSGIKSLFAGKELVIGDDQAKVASLEFSIGASAIRETDDVAAWPERTDTLLYEAKKLGRNRAVVERNR